MWRTLRARDVPEESERDLKSNLLILFIIIEIRKGVGSKLRREAAGKLLQN